jgi:diguanylate cyclase (GGDEF)-like protein
MEPVTVDNSMMTSLPLTAGVRATEGDGPGRRILWATFGLMGVLLAAYFASLVIRPSGSDWTWLDGWSVVAWELIVCALGIARGFLRQRGRVVALTLGCSLLCWSVGDLFLTAESLGGKTPSTPSWADLFYLLFYPLAYVGIVTFMRGQARKLTTPNWLDGIIAGLGAAAVCSAFAFHALVHATGGDALATATNLAYPIGDLLLLGLVVGGTALLSGRRKAPWILLAVGIGANVVGDTFGLVGSTSWVSNTAQAIAWPTAILLISMALWLRPRAPDPLTAQKAAGFLLPNLAAASALAILVIGSLHHVSQVAVGLAAATLVIVGLRLVLSVRGMRSLSQERHRQAVTDELTGLGNRRHLFRVLDAFFLDCQEAETAERRMAFLFVDLNNFKEINDSFGHPAGDELLRQLGARLLGALRDSDLLVRIGGDEFAVALIDGDSDYAVSVAERLTHSLREPFALDVVNARISASIGIAMAPFDASDSAGLLWCADVAMYRAKLGTTPFALYQPDLDEGGNRLQLVEELRQAIETRQLVLHYQPQLDLRSGEILAVEALVRWAHPQMGLVPPLKFLPLAEEAGLMRSLTALVLDEALAQCAAWRESGRPLAVSVNISATNLLDEGFADLVGDLLARYRLPAGALVLELTETSIISDFEKSRHVIEELRGLGLVVSIDDFGAGFTSLAYLSNLAVGELKLDRTFIAGLADGHSGRDFELVRSTIDLGHALGLRVVAEGIEDRETLELLSDLGCDLAQGYFISRPKAANDLAFRSDPSLSRATGSESRRGPVLGDDWLEASPEVPALSFAGAAPASPARAESDGAPELDGSPEGREAPSPVGHRAR